MSEAQQATERAHRRYRSAVLDYGSPQSSDYWLVAYGELLETGGALRSRLRAAAAGLPARERLEATVDAEVLEHMIARWTISIRETIAGGVAS